MEEKVSFPKSVRITSTIYYGISHMFIFMIITGASTAAVAWLLDPAIKKIFVALEEEYIKNVNVDDWKYFC